MYAVILTPKESTFDFIALKAGKRVFRIGKPKEYRVKGEPKVRSILSYKSISPSLLQESVEVDLEWELAKSVDLEKILGWVISLDGII